MTWRVPLTLASLVLHNDIHLYIQKRVCRVKQDTATRETGHGARTELCTMTPCTGNSIGLTTYCYIHMYCYILFQYKNKTDN